MRDELREAESRFSALEAEMSLPENISDSEKYQSMLLEYRRLEPLVEAYRAREEALCEIAAAEELLSDDDAELRALAADELSWAREKLFALDAELKRLLLPRDPDDDKNVIVEIRGGAGGEEAALFCAVLFRMYKMFGDKNNWSVELLDANETELGGYKYVSFSVSGSEAYGKLKYESGVHRVQRVPATESQGRIQTSTATVAVLPEVGEVEIEINPADIKMETYRSSGAGGQHINKTDSAVRLIHVPSGIIAECQEERSQYKNRDKAMKMLRARLYDIKKREQEESISETRRIQVGTGDRSERIRTYNYAQGRVTDHRIGLTLYQLSGVLNGDMESLVNALAEADAAEKLKSMNQGEKV